MSAAGRGSLLAGPQERLHLVAKLWNPQISGIHGPSAHSETPQQHLAAAVLHHALMPDTALVHEQLLRLATALPVAGLTAGRHAIPKRTARRTLILHDPTMSLSSKAPRGPKDQPQTSWASEPGLDRKTLPALSASLFG